MIPSTEVLVRREKRNVPARVGHAQRKRRTKLRLKAPMGGRVRKEGVREVKCVRERGKKKESEKKHEMIHLFNGKE